FQHTEGLGVRSFEDSEDVVLFVGQIEGAQVAVDVAFEPPCGKQGAQNGFLTRVNEVLGL
ncbi:MAG: hypothetical protein EAZ89_15350, partial [Bacteroidetes bacterium]